MNVLATVLEFNQQENIALEILCKSIACLNNTPFCWDKTYIFVKITFSSFKLTLYIHCIVLLKCMLCLILCMFCSCVLILLRYFFCFSLYFVKKSKDFLEDILHDIWLLLFISMSRLTGIFSYLLTSLDRLNSKFIVFPSSH